MKRSISVLYISIAVGIFLYGALLVTDRYTRVPILSHKSAPETQAQISIPSAKITLPIYAAHINNNVWETTSLGVSYLVSSPQPGDIGNSVLYGHNWPRLLGRLKMVKPGDKIYITNSNGSIHRFTVAYVFVVNSDQSEIFGNTNDHRITLYTCTGMFDAKRFIVTAIMDPTPLSTTGF